MKQSAKILHTACWSLLLSFAPPSIAQATGEPLTNAVDILSLAPERAGSGLPVSIQGVVTVAQPDWQGKFFVQDDSAGIFVVNRNSEQPMPGDIVTVTGVTHPGGFAPIINQASWEKVGTAPLPVAKKVSVEQLMAGVEDSQRVEISGIVRATQTETKSVIFEIASSGYRLRAFTPLSVAGDPELLVGTRVRVRGTAATSFHPQLRHLVAITLYVPLASDFIVERSNPGDPFTEPVTPLDSVAQYRRDHTPGRRIHVRGTVAYQRPGEDLFLQDSTGGLQVKSRQLKTLHPGDVVDVIGFPDFDQLLPVLEDAIFRKATASSTSPVARPATLEELQAGLHHADLVTVQGRLLDRTVRDADPLSGATRSSHVVLTVQTSNFLFTAEGPVTESNAELAAIPLNSTVKLTGICLLRIKRGGTLETGDVGTMQSLVILLPSVNSVRVLQRPSWLTPGRLLASLTVLSVISVLAVAWTITVSRKNAALKVLVRDKAKAQAQLQQAHDLLEQRIIERTAALKFEMTARKETEVSFKATLAERTRLAQELHDTLEQSLIGIGLQVDTAAKLVARDAAAGQRHIGIARNLMTQTQLELRRSIWDLRARELDEFDFPEALRMNAQQITENTSLKLEIETSGQPRPLSEVAEENLLRISQAALANVIKHAAASEAKLSLHFGEGEVTLRINDNGQGFIPENRPGAAEGHFGLLGIAERVKRLEGQLQVTSAPGQGTSVEIRIPTARTAGKRHDSTTETLISI